MRVAASTPDSAWTPVADKGTSAEMRRFSAGMRVVTALLCSALVVANEPLMSLAALCVLASYCLWSGWLLWLEANGHARHTGLWCHWVDVTWSCLVMALSTAGGPMLIVTLVYPVVLASIGYGVRQGLLLGCFATLGLLINGEEELAHRLRQGWLHVLPLVLALAAVPAAAVLAGPMNLLRRRLALVSGLEAQLDPRRGLDPICAELVARLRAGTQADVVALLLPAESGAPATVSAGNEPAFRVKPQVHEKFEALLSNAPDCALWHVVRRRFDPRRRTRLYGPGPLPPGASTSLDELAQMLGVRTLHVVPLTRYARRHGHFLVGHVSPRGLSYDISALTSAVPELLRLVEQAALVDQLQEESAAHERARIGRDLHDSAIQPYLGLKYAVECVALRIPKSNPARSEVDSLAELVNAEVAALRELISGLRTGEGRDENTLVPAVRRQVRRFSLLFGIEVEIDCPDRLPTTRALASSLFHMVNEALNNIRKHTSARRAWISLSVHDSTLRLVLRDDAGTVRGRPVDGFRPGSLSDRAAELGGTLQVTFPDGLNTELVIQIPY